MKTTTLLIALVLAITGPICRGECTLPPNYQKMIEDFLAAKNPEYSYTCEYSKPVRALVGESKKEACAILCNFSAVKKETGRLGLVGRGKFLFVGGKMSALPPNGEDQKVEWVEGEPGARK